MNIKYRNQHIRDITTNFSGKDINSGATFNDILINFTGPIVFEDMTLSFNDIKQSAYDATGTLYSGRVSSWKGYVYPNEDEFGLYFGITNFIRLGHPLWLDYVNGKLILDDFTKIGEDGDYDLYFGASYLLGQQWYPVPEYTVSYNKTTRILDFGGTYNGNQVYVGVFRKHRITGDEIIYEDEQVRDAKLVLTPISSSALKSVRDVHPETSRKSLSTIGSVKRTATRSQSVKASPGIQNRTSKSVR